MRIFIFFCFFSLFFFSYPAFSKVNNKLCFQCHKSNKYLHNKYIHKPIISKGCLECHFPHASKNEKLLKKSTNKLCFTCHKKLKNDFKSDLFLHKPYKEQACLRCHIAHSSNYNFLLKNDVKDLCFSCHKNLLVNKQKFLHKPYQDGKCLSCHNAHVGYDVRLLKKENGNLLCYSCHKRNKKFYDVHLGKKEINNCLECHNPHMSNNKFLLKNFEHKPFAEKKCNICHNQKDKSNSLCLNCHKNIDTTFYYFHNHALGGYQKNSCLICHSPHLGNTKILLKSSPKVLCISCHINAYVQKENSLYVHPKRDNCIECHKGHGANNPSMLKGDGNQVCSRCHKTQGKFSHPVGDKVLDPRNGQPITCITCHEPMGTNFKYELKLSGEAALCVECHKNY
ncbi:cytochrome C family protein [Thermodesulfatator indicus DSM 15286]|uniref:Cytochrome C family protein n=1 Tax=Thermodesulfatator indicus (strain DSM 15286 / JCM 11887 / CIR29812) TaxID=667014 RepID=F8ABW0_THEID|nr:cytochrome c3 family protein [Thermodesulfatator indicus]AEH45652.1 cytochrome C family protein [Thermodesulfatator indicus DSM 15286]